MLASIWVSLGSLNIKMHVYIFFKWILSLCNQSWKKEGICSSESLDLQNQIFFSSEYPGAVLWWTLQAADLKYIESMLFDLPTHQEFYIDAGRKRETIKKKFKTISALGSHSLFYIRSEKSAQFFNSGKHF